MCLRDEAAPVLAGHRPAVHLRREHVLLARAEQPRQDAAGDHLALAAVVDVGRVEEGDAALDGAADDRLRLVLGSAHGRSSCGPKLIIPRQTRETRRPVRPRFTYSMAGTLDAPGLPASGVLAR